MQIEKAKDLVYELTMGVGILVILIVNLLFFWTILCCLTWWIFCLTV